MGQRHVPEELGEQDEADRRSEDPQNCKVCPQSTLYCGEKELRGRISKNNPEPTKNLEKNAEPIIPQALCDQFLLFISINLSRRSMPLLFSCPTIVILLWYLESKNLYKCQ